MAETPEAMPDRVAPPEPHVTFELVSLFPEMFDGFLQASLLGRALAAGLLCVERTNPRDFALGKHRSVDDTPCGGGPGMILRPEPIAAALDAITAARGAAHIILLSPQGRLLDQSKVRELATRPRIALVCGRYEGFDDRVGQLLCHEELGIGDYVLAGGELAAAVIIEAVARLLPGVLGCGASALDESFSHDRLEYPQWTRPIDFRGQVVPPVLLSGDHAAIARWRRRESFRRTLERRPDLLVRHPPTDEERRWEAELRSSDPRSPDPRSPD